MQLKRCVTCHQDKELSEYFKCKSFKDGLTNICKGCEREYRQARYARNKASVADGGTKICALCGVTYPIEDFTLTPAIKGGRQSSCKRCTSAARKKRMIVPDKRNAALLSRIRSNCRKFQIPFDLELADMHIPDVCPVLGIPLSLTSTHRDNWPSVDRIIPELGYIKGNVRIISYRANRIKNDATVQELEQVLKYVLACQKMG